MEQLQILIEYLASSIMKFSIDTYGSHAIQHFLQLKPVNVLQFVYDAIVR